MKILMYGWEFLPRISGGLGVACSAIVNELAKLNLKITLVLPTTSNDEVSNSNVSVIGCEQLKKQFNCKKSVFVNEINFIKLNYTSFLHPYLNTTDIEQTAIKQTKQLNAISDKEKLTELIKMNQEFFAVLDSNIT